MVLELGLNTFWVKRKNRGGKSLKIEIGKGDFDVSKISIRLRSKEVPL